MESVFDRLPEGFFLPLASPGRRHYAALLLVFYRLFMEYHSSLERTQVVKEFREYFEALDDQELAGVEADEDDAPQPESGAGRPMRSLDPQGLASAYLRRLIGYGWMNEEELPNFERVINMSGPARPFFEALDNTERGAGTEYESHIVAVYSSLCGDAARENGEHAVLNAHSHTRLLVESLKVLDQNIKSHVQRIFARDATVPEILHAHYDLYMHEVVDRAYTRLKTSDNLSRYRPRINRAIGAFLKNERWLAGSAERLALIKRVSVEQGRTFLVQMLNEIRGDLQAIDPILESIDDRNRRYSRISTERIRSQIHTDATLAGSIGAIVRAWKSGSAPADARHTALDHRLVRLRFVDAASLYSRRNREITSAGLAREELDRTEAAIAEAELVLRVRNQLNPEKIARFLALRCPRAGGRAWASGIVEGVGSYVRLMYAANYAESRQEDFPYAVEWSDDMVTVGDFRFREHEFIRKYDRG